MGFARKLKRNQQRGSGIRAEFTQKNEILRKKFLPIAPLVYYENVFGDDIDKRRSYVRTKAKPIIRYADNFTAMLAENCDNSDFYIRLCSFFNHYPTMSQMETLYGLIVDIDDVSPVQLQMILKSDVYQRYTPTFIVNSGKGVHLAYIWTNPLTAWDNVKIKVKALYKALRLSFKGISDGIKVDMRTSIMQSFRVVGSRTKLGQIATAYISGQKWDYDDLANRLNVANLSKPTKPATEKKEKPCDIIHLPNAKRGFFDYTLRRIYTDTKEGNRYMAMVALVVIAYKCRGKVTYDELVADLYKLVDHFNQIGSRVYCSEIQQALQAYNYKATKTTSETLENWLGWKYERKSKRNGRKQKEHLELARQAKQAKQDEKLDMMKRYLKQSPNATLTELVDVLGLSKPTVIKYRRIAKGN